MNLTNIRYLVLLSPRISYGHYRHIVTLGIELDGGYVSALAHSYHAARFSEVLCSRVSYVGSSGMAYLSSMLPVSSER